MQTPGVQVNSKRHGLPVFSTVIDKEQMRWKSLDGTLNWDTLIDFLRHVIKNAAREIYLILDNLRVERAFCTMKRQFHLAKAKYFTAVKVRAQMSWAVPGANLLMANNKLKQLRAARGLKTGNCGGKPDQKGTKGLIEAVRSHQFAPEAGFDSQHSDRGVAQRF